jgi:nicotinate-nucleotide adenylyltransferase
MRVAILGGSFNPIHNSHLKLIRYVYANHLADEVWVMPCKKHPLDKLLDKVEDRVAMVKLALEGIEGAKFCDLELKKDGKSYTYETLRALKQLYPHHFSWITGSDILRQLPEWYGYEHLQKEASFIVFERQGYPIIDAEVKIEATVNAESDNISSTKIRERVRKGKSITDLVPKVVEDYIKENNLYKT